MNKKFLFFTLPFMFFLGSQATVFAVVKKEPLIIAGWLPYWKKTEAASSTIGHFSTLSEISPFSYTVKKDGTLFNPMKTDEEPWLSLFTEARKQKVKIYPTILWNDKDNIEIILNSKKRRASHIASIVSEVKKNRWDGIDIDYEGKSAESRDGYSAFVKELGKALDTTNKDLICTIEARTPIDSRYASVTPELLARIEYANDYKAIGKYCDEVRIMAYDQSTDDLKLTQANQNDIYRPVSDIDWVKKVLTLALEDMPAKKIMVGVPTYGYKYEVITTGGVTKYSRIGSMNYSYADELAKSLQIIPSRNKAGELSFNYVTTTPSGEKKTYLVWYSDATAIADKLKIAKLYNLKGIAIFKLDGAFDPKLWDILPKKK